MKKIILFIYFFFCIFLWNNAFADIDAEIKKTQEQLSWANWSEADRLEEQLETLKKQKESSNSWSWQSEIIVKVPEKVPGANCGEKDASTWLYECKIKPGFKSVQSIMGNIIKWATAIAALSWVLFIVVNGIMLSTGSESGEVKKRIIAGIIWLILVLLSWVILNIIAPWVYK